MRPRGERVCDLGRVEPQPGPFSIAEADNSELGGVLVDVLARDVEAAGYLGRVNQLIVGEAEVFPSSGKVVRLGQQLRETVENLVGHALGQKVEGRRLHA